MCCKQVMHIAVAVAPDSLASEGAVLSNDVSGISCESQVFCNNFHIQKCGWVAPDLTPI